VVPSVLRFLHVSDIHFSASLDDVPDLDVEHHVRNRMMVDFAHMRDELGEFDAVLVVGDIAARGEREEYQVAANFLASTTAVIGCASDQVICVPGNHDVDRGRHGPLHRLLRREMRSVAPELISDSLLAVIRDEPSARILFGPIEEYNRFALAFGCDISTTRPTWQPKEFSLEGRSVTVHGVTSSWIADESDSSAEDASKLVAGLFQVAAIGSAPDDICVSLCHHPPGWLRDAEILRPWLAQSSLVLTGHEHESSIQVSEDGRTVYVSSGAVNPERTGAGWIPAYNVIEIAISDDPAADISLSIYGRVWQGASGHAEFGPNDDQPQPFTVVLTTPSVAVAAPPAPNVELIEQLPSEPMVSTRHSLVNLVMQASPDDRLRVAMELGIDVPAQAIGFDADRVILTAAIQSDLLAELASRLVQGSENV